MSSSGAGSGGAATSSGLSVVLQLEDGIAVELLLDALLEGEDGKLENFHRLDHVRSELHPLLHPHLSCHFQLHAITTLCDSGPSLLLVIREP